MIMAAGSIRVNLSVFGANQYRLPEQAAQLSVYFTLQYFVLKCGSVLARFVAPILRQDVQCFGMSDCYPLSFGVSVVVMMTGFFFLICGNALYVKRPPSGNMLMKVCGCVMVRDKICSLILEQLLIAVISTARSGREVQSNNEQIGAKEPLAWLLGRQIWSTDRHRYENSSECASSVPATPDLLGGVCSARFSLGLSGEANGRGFRLLYYQAWSDDRFQFHSWHYDDSGLRLPALSTSGACWTENLPSKNDDRWSSRSSGLHLLRIHWNQNPK